MVRVATSLFWGIVITFFFCILAPLIGGDQERNLPELISPVQLTPFAPPPEKPKEKRIVQKKILELPKTKTQKREKTKPLEKIDIQVQPLNLELASTLAATMPLQPQQVQKMETPTFQGTGVLDLSAVDKAPKIKRYMPPLYPAKAKGQGIEGRVVVRCIVTAGGRVQNPTIIDADPPGYFEKAALKSVKKWSFTPARYKGEKVAVYVEIPLSFTLD